MTGVDTSEIRRVGLLMVDPTTVFVFGSNLAGAHAGGAAKKAFDEYGARWGMGVGLQGRSYAIPTMDAQMQPLSIDEIAAHVETFMEFADSRPDLTFAVTRIGCGIAGFTDTDIAPLFTEAPNNCELPEGWRS